MMREDVLYSFGELRCRVAHNNEFCDIETQAFDRAHIHSWYEIYVNLSGDVSFLHDKEVYRIELGDVIFSRPGDVHCCMYHSSCIHEHVCIWFERNPALEQLIDRLEIPARIRFSKETKKAFLQCLRRFSDQENDSFLRAAAFIELLSQLGRERQPQAEYSEDMPKRLRDILYYIDEHYREAISPNQIAEAFYLSTSTLNRLFRVYVGLSVSRLIEAKRISYAEKLLRADETVTDACFHSGFSDCSRFIARFKDKFGVTPLQYKILLRRSESNL